MKPLSLEMSSRPLSPSRSLKARDEHEATFSGDELKATVSLSFSQAFSGDELKATASLSFSLSVVRTRT